jgi:pimeloyl-ACP methyl ester carboxylesterase
MHIDDYRDDLLALAPSWDLVVGHSLGGTLALTALAAEPGWTNRLILEDPLLILEDPAAVRLELLEAVTDPIDDEATIRAQHPRWHPHDVAVEARSFRQCGSDTIDRLFCDTGAFDLRPLFDAFRIPTLLLGADPTLGPVLPPDLGEAIAAGHPDVHFEVVPGGSHSMHRDAYNEFWAIIDQFLAATGR